MHQTRTVATWVHQTRWAPARSCPTGTPVPKTAPTPTGAPPSSRNVGTNPGIATSYRSNMTVVQTTHYAVATANPLATQAACRVLRDGGTAADALVAVQAVLGLVEPQSSGIGGGGFVVYYDARAGSVQAYDGREAAPAAATENYLRWISDVDHSAPRPTARASGRSIGVPGILRMLEIVHNEHGRTAWRDLFGPAVALADGGFDISPRMAKAITDSLTELRVDPQARGYFLNPDGSPKASGTRLTNPAYAKALAAIASAGASAFYTGDIAHDIVAAVRDPSDGRTPGQMTPDDLAGYVAKKREPLCTTYRDREICGMPPPSSGGLAVAATLGVLEHFPMSSYRPGDVDLNGGQPDVMGVHLISEAERLAYADRDKYVADTDFVQLPGRSLNTLIDPAYLAGRAAMISPEHSMGSARPGDFGTPTDNPPPVPEHGTSHISIVDSYGNAAAMTTTVESPFGSFHMVDGFILNNQLTDFAAEPRATDGSAVANRVEPGKRPRSTMAPTLVFDRSPKWAACPGCTDCGGGLARRLVDHPICRENTCGDAGLGSNPQQAVSMVDFGADNSPETNVGCEHPCDRHLRQRRPRPTGAGPARTRTSGQPGTAIQRTVGDRPERVEMGRRRRPAQRGRGDGRQRMRAGSARRFRKTRPPVANLANPISRKPTALHVT